tara:strand:+ start:2536 stop:4359 length:1824 start_codon:yes stop_codon:yes gene_type:complete
MMEFNPDKYLSQKGGFNPDAYLSGQSVQSVQPAPEMSAGQQALRAGEFGARGFLESAAETVGAVPELVSAGMREIGLEDYAPEAGYYPKTIKSGIQNFGRAISPDVDFGPSTPQSNLERGAYGTGRGVADAASFMVPGAIVAKTAQAGTMPARMGSVMASQPVAQAVAGGVGGGVSEATGNNVAGLAASLAVPTVPALAKSAVRKVITPFPSQLSPNEQRLSQAAEQAGIKLTPGQITGSPGLRTMESSFAQLPLTSKSQIAIYEEQRKAFNRAVLSKAGIKADEASPEVMDGAFKSIGKEFDDLANKTTIQADQKMIDDITSVAKGYGKRLTADTARVFDSYLDDFANIQKEITVPKGQSLGQTPVVQIPGAQYQTLSSDIKRRARKAGNNPDLQDALYAFSSKLDDALERSSGPELRGAWADVRNRYRNMLTIDKSMGGGTQSDIAAANIPFGSLKTAVRGMDKTGYARGRGDLNELSRVGGFLGSAIPPDSGTARRTLMQNLLTFGAGGGGVGYAAAGGSPLTAMISALAAVGGPKAVQAATSPKAIQSYLKNQAMAPTQENSMIRALLGKIAIAQQAGDTMETSAEPLVIDNIRPTQKALGAR